MALVDMKSNLAISKPPGLEPAIGVDNFPNTNATGFTLKRNTTGLETDYILNDSGGPIIPQTAYLDIKGDTISIFSPTNPAYPNIYNTGTSTPTPLQAFPIPTNNAVDRNGAFLPPYNAPNPYISVGTGVSFGISDTGGFGGAAVSLFNQGVTGGPPTPANTNPPGGPSVESFVSKLLILHENGREPTFGFTRPGISLTNRYAQQPTNFRNIGQRWRDGGIDIPLVPGFVESTLDVLANLASPVFGRDIPIFTNQYKASVNRIGQFANPVSTYALKQTFLHRKNKYDRPYTQVMGIGGDNSLRGSEFVQEWFSGISMVGAIASDAGLLDLNPQVYNQASVFSIPGVSGMMFNRNGRNIQDVAGLTAAGIDIGVTAVKNLGSAITNVISSKAISLSQKREGKTISIKGLGALGEPVGNYLKQGLRSIGGALGKIEVGKIKGGNTSTKSLGSIFGSTADKLSSIKKPAIVQRTQQLASDFGGSVVDTAVSVGQGVGEFAKTAAGLAKRTQGIAKDLSEDVGIISKHQISKLDHRAFEDVAVDKVNLIPYGSTKYKEDDHSALDLVPFKFIDVRENAPIVFRAILSGITDTFSPEYASERYVGRPDNVYVYQGTTREISFNFDVYPKSDAELVTLWEKLNYLAGLTYPHLDKSGLGMIAPFSKLQIGDMYNNVPGYISSLTYSVQDNGTWEVDFAKLPKYIQVACTFVYIGDVLPTAKQKHFGCDWIGNIRYTKEGDVNTEGFYNQPASVIGAGIQGEVTSAGKKFLKSVGL